MKNKYNGFQKASEWLGKRVYAVRQINNSGGYGVSRGMCGTVKDVYAGLSISFDVCRHCGTVTHVSRVGYHDVALLGDAANFTTEPERGKE
jgi:hypothetical protein